MVDLDIIQSVFILIILKFLIEHYSIVDRAQATNESLCKPPLINLGCLPKS